VDKSDTPEDERETLQHEARRYGDHMIRCESLQAADLQYRLAARIDVLERELAALREGVPRRDALMTGKYVIVPKAWFEAVPCPNPGCDGKGWKAVQVDFDQFVQEQCQWCDERKAVSAAFPALSEHKGTPRG
jgi:hypothetical protein